MRSLGFAVMMAVVACKQEPSQSEAAPPVQAREEPWGDFAACMRGVLPDYSCTPGAIMTVNLQTICHTSTDTRRHVNRELRTTVYREYGVPYPQASGMYEVDHLIPLELGGSNDINNLWLEAAEPRPGFHEKDQVENYLHAQVCKGAMTLEEAQRQIRTNWLDVYRRLPSRL